MSVFDRLTPACRRIFTHSREEAVAWGHPFMGTCHLLLAMLRVRSEVRGLLRVAQTGEHPVRRYVRLVVGRRPRSLFHLGMVPFSSATKRVIECAEQTADLLRIESVSELHLFLGLLLERHGVASSALRDLYGLTAERVVARIVEKSTDHRGLYRVYGELSQIAKDSRPSDDLGPARIGIGA